MTNLKKTLAVVLAFAMIFSMGSVFAYSDVEAGTIVSEAVTILSNLNIFTGFEDGTFRPEETVTRAQMAAIICRMLGYEDQAQSSTGSTVFDDVAADHWASGYINVAQAQGIINGYGNGNFGPEDKVTYEQAVKMIVSSLGYDIIAAKRGGYPTGYLAIASTEGITKKANGKVGDAAARSTIAVLVYNSLEVRLVDQESWSLDGTDSFTRSDDTILSSYLEVEKYEGIVKSTAMTDIAENGYDADATAEATIKGQEIYYEDGKLTKGSLKDITANADKVDVDSYLGKSVVVYVGTDAVTEEDTFLAIAEKQGANETLKLNSTQLVSNSDNGKLVYKKPDSNKKYDVKINLTTAYNNFEAVTGLDNTDDIIAQFIYGGTIELIDSDTTTAGYETAIILNYDEEAVVEEVEVEDSDIYFTLYAGNLDDIDTESETELVVVYKDGELADATAIAAGDTVSTVEIGSSARILYVSSKSVTGVVEGWDDDYVTIGDEEYAPSDASGYSISDLANKEGIFYLNIDGQISYADASASKGGYAFFLNTGKDAGLGSKYYATIVGVDGEAVQYNYAKNVTINGTGKTSEQAATYIAGLMGHSGTKDEAYAYVDTAEDLLFEVKIKNGEIKDLVSVGYRTPSSTSKYNEDTQSLGAKTFDDNSVMFALAHGVSSEDLAKKIEEDDIKVGKAIEMLADDEEYYVALAGLEKGIYNVAVGYNLVTSVAKDGELIVITGKKVRSYNDESATVITGLQGGKEVEIILYNEDGFNSNNDFEPASLAIGDIILTSAVNAEGVANDFVVVFDKDLSTKAANADDIYYGYKIATDVDDNFIWFAEAMEGITEESDSTHHYMAIQRSANTVLVDYEEDVTEPEISKKSLSKSLIGRADKYNSYVFVRVIDEVIVDVVVYRYLD